MSVQAGLSSLPLAFYATVYRAANDMSGKQEGGEALYNSPNSLSRSSQFELPGRMFGNLSNNDLYSFKNMNKSETTDSSDGCFGSLKQTCTTQNRKQPVQTSSLSEVLLTPQDDLSLADPLSVLREPQDSSCSGHLAGHL